MLFNKHIFKYIKRYIAFYIIGLIALIAVDYVQLFVPEIIGDIINIVNGETEGEFMPLIWKTIMVAVVMMVGRMIWRFAVFYGARKIESRMRHDMFLHAEKMSQTYFHIHNVGSVMDWFTNDLETVEEFIGWGFIMMVDSIFLSIFVIVKMVVLDFVEIGDGLLSGLSAIPIIFIIIWGALVEKIMSEKWEFRQKEFDRLYDYSRESFTGIRVIKAFVKERQQIKAFSKEAKRNKDANIKFVKTSVFFDVVIEVIIELSIVLLLLVGGYKVYVGTYRSGDMVKFIGYFESLIWPMIALGQIVSMKSRANASMKRITAFLDSEIEIKDDPDAVSLTDCKGKIEFRNFTFTYQDERKNTVLENINLTINPGEKIGIIGKIGSGKTTLVNSLFHLYNIDLNQIFIDDIDMMKIKLYDLRENIAYAMQDNYLFSDSVKNNIAFYNTSIDSERVIEAAKFSDVHENIVEFQEGYETVSGERGVTLSGGQKQRIGIARAYIKNSPILVLDDSVAAVDLKTEEKILENIFKYRANKTTIMIASRVSTVAHMDKIIVLADGKVEAFDSPQNLMKISPTYQKMVYLQKLEQEVEGGH